MPVSIAFVNLEHALRGQDGGATKRLPAPVRVPDSPTLAEIAPPTEAADLTSMRATSPDPAHAQHVFHPGAVLVDRQHRSELGVLDTAPA